jgi:hypothetical protein
MSRAFACDGAYARPTATHASALRQHAASATFLHDMSRLGYVPIAVDMPAADRRDERTRVVNAT